MNYKVLWIDDEHDKEENFKLSAEISGLDIIARGSADEGLDELKRNRIIYDAVILDAKVKKEKDSAPDLSGLRAARDYLLGLKGDEFLPFFIYTGQTAYQSDGIFNESFGKYYKKGEDDEQLIQDILIAIKDRPNTLIRRQHPNVFELFKNGFIGQEYEKHLIKILKSITEDKTHFDDELYLNQLRQMLEVAMRRANEVGILHDKCINHKGEVILKLSSIFMSGEQVNKLNIKCKKSHFPKIITDHVFDILDITNIGSHADKDGKEESEANLKEYRNKLNTPYLLYSLTFKLMDVLLWFSEYIKENSDIKFNKSFWVDLSTTNETYLDSDGKWKKGTVTRIAENGWGTFAPDESSETISIPPSMVRDNNIEEYQKIEVITKPSADGIKLHIESIRT